MTYGMKKYLARLSNRIIAALDSGRGASGRCNRLRRIARRNIIVAGYSPEMANQLVADAIDDARNAFEFTF